MPLAEAPWAVDEEEPHPTRFPSAARAHVAHGVQSVGKKPRAPIQHCRSADAEGGRDVRIRHAVTGHQQRLGAGGYDAIQRASTARPLRQDVPRVVAAVDRAGHRGPPGDGQQLPEGRECGGAGPWPAARSRFRQDRPLRRRCPPTLRRLRRPARARRPSCPRPETALVGRRKRAPASPTATPPAHATRRAVLRPSRSCAPRTAPIAAQRPVHTVRPVRQTECLPP